MRKKCLAWNSGLAGAIAREKMTIFWFGKPRGVFRIEFAIFLRSLAQSLKSQTHATRAALAFVTRRRANQLVQIDQQNAPPPAKTGLGARNPPFC